MSKKADRVRETTVTTGTGTVTLAGAVSAYRTFASAFSNNDSVYYVIAGPSEWEVGSGVYNAGTLSRVKVEASSNAGALVSFSAGSKDVFCSQIYEDQYPVVKNSTAANEVCTIPASTQMLVVSEFNNAETLETLGELDIIDSFVPLPGAGLTLGALNTTTGGTSVDFTGIPSWVKRITLRIKFSTNGTSIPLLQLGDSGGVETNAYEGSSINNAATQLNWSATTGVALTSSAFVAANTYYCRAIIDLQDAASNTWFIDGRCYPTAVNWNDFIGLKATSATLDRIRITTTNGTDTFDVMSANIAYE